ncbi:MAG: MCP four helix bundle domain-containing protein [Spirochaetes bacterium]|nr:MCP four helix bundle domain-containing protein [Spirochaetota bacterium]
MKWFNNLRVSLKVFLSCLVFLVIIAAISIQGIYAIRTADADFGIFYNDRFTPVRQLNHIMRNLLQIRVNMVQEMLSAENNDWGEVAKRKEDSKKLSGEYMELWKKFTSTAMTAEEKKLADEWEKLAEKPKAFRASFARALDARDLALSKKYLEEWKVEYQALRDQTDRLIEVQQKEAEKLLAEQSASARNTTIMAVAFLVVAIAMGMVITAILSGAVSRPVGKGLDFARKIADGDLTQRIDLDQKDELGQLAVALNRAADSLESLISNVTVASQNLSQAVEQISSGNQNLSQRSSEQASSLEEIASTIEEATATINQNAENAIRAKDLTEGGSVKSLEGNKVAVEAVNAIVEMNESSKKVADIISTINEIAFQTNLLALNAAVEAARAGEQGRGFAVVAGEVRNLAQRSGNAAKEIESLIRDALSKVDKSTELVNQTGSSLNEISEAAKTTSQIINEIAAASQEQKQGINQINTAISEMDNMTQQNASLVEETASASEEMANQAQELLDMVRKFKIREQMQNDAYKKKHHELHLRAAENSKKALADGNGNGRGKGADAVAARALPGDQMKDLLHKEGFEEF